MKHYTILPTEANELQAAVSTLVGKRIIMPEIVDASPAYEVNYALLPDLSICREYPNPPITPSLFNEKLQFDKVFCGQKTCVPLLVFLERGKYDAVFVCGDGTCYVCNPRASSPLYTTWKAYAKKNPVSAVFTIRTGQSIISNRLTYAESEVRAAQRHPF